MHSQVQSQAYLYLSESESKPAGKVNVGKKDSKDDSLHLN